MKPGRGKRVEIKTEKKKKKKKRKEHSSALPNNNRDERLYGLFCFVVKNSSPVSAGF